MTEIIDAFATDYKLSKRQKEVLELLVTSDQSAVKSSKELGVSKETFSYHRSMLYAKTRTGTRVALIHLWQRYLESRERS